MKKAILKLKSFTKLKTKLKKGIIKKLFLD